MFGIALLIEVYGVATDRLDFSGIMLVVTLVPMVIYAILGILEMRKFKR